MRFFPKAILCRQNNGIANFFELRQSKNGSVEKQKRNPYMQILKEVHHIIVYHLWLPKVNDQLDSSMETFEIHTRVVRNRYE